LKAKEEHRKNILKIPILRKRKIDERGGGDHIQRSAKKKKKKTGEKGLV